MEEMEAKEKGRRFGVRHLQMILMFLCLLFFHTLRANMSIAIVVMSDTSKNEHETFNWDFSKQSTILSSFFWGYACGQIPAGQLAQRFGPRILLLIMMFICALLNLITPIAASIGDWQTVCVLRVLQGLSQSFVFPCAHTMMSKWAPSHERARMSAFCYAVFGGPLGFVVMYGISGFLASSVVGWPSIFYVSGTGGILWAILWFFYGSNSPAEYKNISQVEKDLIEHSKGTSTISRLEIKKTPWLAIFTSLPFLSLILAHLCTNWGYVTLLTLMPTYMKNVLDLDIEQNALYNALPYFLTWISSLTFSLISDCLMNKKILNAAKSRKLYNSIGSYGPMVMMISLGFVTKDNIPLAIVLLCLSGTLYGAVYVGYLLNHIDLAPNFAGTLMGITNGSAAIIAIIAPLVSGFIIDKGPNDLAQWRIVFFITAIFYFVGNTLFVIFGKGEIQKWNNPE